MVPASNTGAATPIDMGGGNVGSDLRGKLIHDSEAQMRFLAGGSGRNAAAAAQAVEPKSPACLRCPRSWTASEALHEHLIEVVAADLPALLAQADGRTTVRKHLHLSLAGATVARHELPLQLRVLDILLDPNLITLLFLAGILGLAVELTHPGLVLPGLLGGVSLILALLGLAIVPFSWAGIALFAFGIALLALEAHVPAHGAFAGTGALSLLLGSVILFRVDGSPYGTTSFWLALGLAGSLAIISMFVVTRIWQARRLPARGGGETLVGELATVVTGLHPAGQVLIRGERWQARLASGSAESGEEVRVTAQHGLVLDVEHEPAGSLTPA
jgi:membrane-bound serine protease (ClpP class)